MLHIERWEGRYVSTPLVLFNSGVNVNHNHIMNPVLISEVFFLLFDALFVIMLYLVRLHH